ncbi:brevican core protein-like [Ruditapes philippinarum]|uniref:brevican core protein-like n=1 Tax=Ruditapes philippinarum TaxID=129788 RepID=UPI00295C267A|nr:brevican core protein-like [Ruditapes philippinarum]
MKSLTFPLLICVVFLTHYFTSVELHSLRNGPNGKRCLDSCQCPNGTACLAEDNEEGKKSKKRCQPCGCRVNSQCFKSFNEVLCDCSNSGYTGSNCETKIETCNVDDGWTIFEGGCYLYVSTPLDWYSAKSDCQSKGAYLVEITTEAERNFVDLLAESNAWSGLTDTSTETEFVWYYSGLTPTSVVDRIYFNSDSNDCVVIYVDWGSPFVWDANPCNAFKAYICEK